MALVVALEEVAHGDDDARVSFYEPVMREVDGLEKPVQRDALRVCRQQCIHVVFVPAVLEVALRDWWKWFGGGEQRVSRERVYRQMNLNFVLFTGIGMINA